MALFDFSTIEKTRSFARRVFPFSSLISIFLKLDMQDSTCKQDASVTPITLI